MAKTLSPLRYPGGKSCYLPLIADIIKLNQLEGCVYAEPFAGGAGAALALLELGIVSKILLNDLDIAIYSFWDSVLNNTSNFIDLIEKTPITVNEWKIQKTIYKKQKEVSLELGFATFFLNRCNRSGIILANPIGGINQTGNYKISARFNKEKLIEKIAFIASKKQQIKIYNLDATEFVSRLRYRKQKVLVYFDPPYYKKGELLYLNHFSSQDHQTLKDSIINCKYPWLLSYDNNQAIIELYAEKKFYTQTLNYSIKKPSKAKELIISDLIMPSNMPRLGTI